MGARMSGGGAHGPHKLGRRGQGVGASPGLVAPWCIPVTSYLSQKFLNIPEKIILEFQGIWRTFIFRSFFIERIMQKTGK